MSVEKKRQTHAGSSALLNVLNARLEACQMFLERLIIGFEVIHRQSAERFRIYLSEILLQSE